jgi:hypothetical protein
MGQYMSNRNLIASLVFVFAAGGLWAGCTVGFSPEQENVFPCESNADCLDDYECGETTGYCKLIVTDEEAPPCDASENGIDQDGDGYGAGPERENCEFEAEDCNDNDIDVFPGAPELCDGQVNDCSMLEDNMDATEASVFSCTGDDDSTCPDLADVPEGVISISNYRSKSCESGQCVYKSLRSTQCSVDGTPIDLTCVDGTTGYSWVSDSTKTYEDLPEACRTEQ